MSELLAPDRAALATMLKDLVEVMIPGDGPWPSAATVGVQGVLAARLVERKGTDAVAQLAAAIQRCGGPLSALDESGRVAVVAKLEREHGDLFALVRNATYLAYYESPAVVPIVQSLGQPYDPIPHTKGYALQPFDMERDRPRHGRGRYTPTDQVRPVDLSKLGGNHHGA